MDNKNNCLLYGASGHGKVVFDTLKSRGISVPVIFDDDSKIENVVNIKVSLYTKDLYNNVKLIISIGNNRVRKHLSTIINHSYFTITHRNSIIDDTVVINEGSVVFAGAIIQSSTIIGKHVIINTKASVDHDCVIGDFVHIAPGATICGGVKVEEGTFIGAGAVVLPNVKIGKWVVVGAGAVVIKNIEDNEAWVGNPARKIK